MNQIKVLINVLIWMGSIAYPFLWYFGQSHFGMRRIALFMALLWLLRAVQAKKASQGIVAVVLVLFFVLIAWQNSQASMYAYPVLVSLLLLGLFAGSLFTSQSMIERLARLQHPDLSTQGVRYTRRVTQIWCGFFVLNTLIVLVLIQAEYWQAWVLYTGLISYVLMGILFLGEWLYRHWVLKI